MVGPTLSADGLTLYMHSMATQLFEASRERVDASFGPMVQISTGLDLAASPDLSADCRAMYFIGVSGSDAGLYVMRR